MERRTQPEYEYHSCDFMDDGVYIDMNRLREYEDTGLTPEQIQQMKEILSRENTPEIARSSRDNGGWIPVERELDDERETGIDITTYGDATLGGNKLDYKEWRNPFPYFKGNYKVIAWRPLPDPYRPERSNDEKK